MSKLIYLAGAMDTYRDNNYDRAIKWRNKIRAELVHYNDNYYTNFKVFDPTTFEDDRHDIVTQNIYYLNKADIVVANIKNLDKSLGTICELVIAKTKDTPIITFGKHEWVNHPYMKELSSVHLNNEEEVVKFIGETYRQ